MEQEQGNAFFSRNLNMLVNSHTCLPLYLCMSFLCRISAFLSYRDFHVVRKMPASVSARCWRSLLRSHPGVSLCTGFGSGKREDLKSMKKNWTLVLKKGSIYLPVGAGVENGSLLLRQGETHEPLRLRTDARRAVLLRSCNKPQTNYRPPYSAER